MSSSLFPLGIYPVIPPLKGSPRTPLLQKIWPLKQKEVNDLISWAEGNPNIIKLIVFGSALLERCHIRSDLDLCITYRSGCSYDERAQIRLDICDISGNVDILNSEDLDPEGRLFEEIQEGLVIYEQLV